MEFVLVFWVSLAVFLIYKIIILQEKIKDFNQRLERIKKLNSNN